MKKLFTLFAFVFIALTAFAQEEHSFIINAESFRAVQADALTGVNIDPIGKDMSRNACARIKVKMERMSKEEIAGIEIMLRSNNQIIKQKVGDYENLLIFELTAKPNTRFYFHHNDFGDSNEVTLNLEGDREYLLEASLNHTFSVVVDSNVVGAEVYIDNIFKGYTDDYKRCTISDVIIGDHALKLVYGDSVTSQNIAVHRKSIAFRQDVALVHTTESYKIGDVVNVNGVQGIVFQTTPVVKIVSITKCPHQWKYGKSFSGRISRNNGVANMEIVHCVKNWQKKFPAFKWCADLGSGWYLPANRELTSIWKQKDIINSVLSAYQTTLSSSDFNFSSTDVDKYMAKRKGGFCKKNCYGTIRAVYILPTSKPTTSSPYKVGDYYNEDGKEGIVFEVSEDGKHGKIVSIAASAIYWGSSGFLGATDRENGEFNTSKIKPISDYDMFEWAVDLGVGWYIPSINELHSLYKQMSMVNKKLDIVLGAETDTIVGGYFLASSTEYDDDERLILSLSDGSIHLYGKCWNTIEVRAVAVF